MTVVSELCATTESCVTYDGCLGELSCSCPFAMEQRQVCKHLEAAAQQQPFSHSLRLHAASYVADQGLLTLEDEAEGTCTCRYGLSTQLQNVV